MTSAGAPMVVVGAGQAGLQIAESLRAEGWGGRVVLLGDEPVAPYHRPPLSKGVLLGETDPAQIEIRGPEALAKKGIELHTGAAVTAIDRAAREVALSDGSTLAYSGLALATGARVRPLPVPGAELAGVHDLRTLADSRRLMDAVAAGGRLAVVGGGFIGLEVAAAARKRGLSVTVLEAADRLMARAVSPLISDTYAALHAEHGVEILLNAQVEQITGADGRATGVRTRDGRIHAADTVVVGIGVIPNDELARACGLECDRGIVVDACARTADPLIVAAGDCTARRTAEGTLIRLESVQNAVEQGKAAAAALMGKEKPFTASPWFWSDQYDVKLQMVGSSAGHDAIAIRGDRLGRKFSAFYFREGRLIGVDSLNRPQDHMMARRLLDRGNDLTPEQAEDESRPLTA